MVDVCVIVNFLEAVMQKFVSIISFWTHMNLIMKMSASTKKRKL